MKIDDNLFTIHLLFMIIHQGVWNIRLMESTRPALYSTCFADGVLNR